MTDHSSTIKDLAHRLQTKFQELDDVSHKVGSFKGAGEQLSEDAVTLSRLTENFDMISAVFPVYGVVKAGKSTFLACLIGEMVLPEQAAPMTSIPIRIKHVSGISEKRLVIPQFERWNCCITGFEQKLLSGALDKEFPNPNEINGNFGSGNDAELYRVQELIRTRMISFSAVTIGDSIRTAADVISHFVRLLWINKIDFEMDYGISLDIDSLPTIEISMEAFKSYGNKSFSLLDTPGPNEAKASEALTKLGPQIMKHSSGCIVCIPWQQVDANQQMPIYDYINRSMIGKRVIIIVTLWDTFKDTATSAPKNMIDKIRSFFNVNMRPHVTIHLTSGHKMFAMLKLEQLLLDHKERGSDETTILSAVDQSSIASSLQNDSTGGGYLARSLWSIDSLANFVCSARKELKSDEVLQSFRTLYDESEQLALNAHVATLESVHSRWLSSFRTLEEFVTSSGERRAEIQKKLQDTGDVYRAVVNEMSILPNKVREAVGKYMDEAIGKGLMEFAETMSNWKVCIEKSDGTIERREEIDFPGGKAGILIWINSPRCMGKLVSFMERPTRQQLDQARGGIPGVIHELYSQCSDLVERVILVDGSGAMGDMNVYFRETPSFDFDIDLYVKIACLMDVNEITFREEPHKCVIVNDTFKDDVHRLFKTSFSNAVNLISTKLYADLDDVFTDFSNLVQAELESVKGRYERNQEFLNQQLEAADLRQTLSELQIDDDFFVADIAKLKNELLQKKIY